MKSLESGVIWGQRRSGRVPENLILEATSSYQPGLCLWPWIQGRLSLTRGPQTSVWALGGGLATPRKLGAIKCERERRGIENARLPGLTHTLLQTSVSLKRIQHFLSQDELDSQCVERKTITPGPDTATWAALTAAPAPENPCSKLLTFLL